MCIRDRNIVISELSGVGIKVQPLQIGATSENGGLRDNVQRTLDASRNLDFITDKRFVAITPTSSGSITADYTITGTNFSGSTISETISGINPSGGTQYSKQSFSTVSQITTSNVTSDVTLIAVSYTHLTLPTKRIV